ncbi:MAG: FHA domain-containing protein [Bacillota bacterium]
MNATAYEIAALSMRYVFLVLVLLIVLQLVTRSVSEFRALQRFRRQLRSASPGYLEVHAPEDIRGERFALRRETTIGKARRCDIWIDAAGLAPVHAAIYERKGKVYLADYGSKNGVILNGVRMDKKDEQLFDGDRIGMGEMEFYLYLLASEDKDEQA